eukprot:sb/3467719/
MMIARASDGNDSPIPENSSLSNIHIDIPRTNPAVQLFQEQKVQDAFERILYIWAYRNPGSGYVQGINDLVTPFYVVFLSQYVEGNERILPQSKISVSLSLSLSLSLPLPLSLPPSLPLSPTTEGNVEKADISQLADEILANTEADTYWCLCKLLESLHDNYTFAQPGIQMKVHDLRRLVNRIDKTLDDHLERNLVEYLQFSFRWMNNLLMREMPLSATIRLWDTYFAEPVYPPPSQAIMLFVQSLPTSSWGDDEVSELVSEAFQLKCLFPKAERLDHARAKVARHP